MPLGHRRIRVESLEELAVIPHPEDIALVVIGEHSILTRVPMQQAIRPGNTAEARRGSSTTSCTGAMP